MNRETNRGSVRSTKEAVGAGNSDFVSANLAPKTEGHNTLVSAAKFWFWSSTLQCHTPISLGHGLENKNKNKNFIIIKFKH